MIRIRSPLKAVLRAAKRLDKEGGRVARRNARAQVFGAIRALENAIDREYPLIEKPKLELAQTLEAQARRMTALGFRRVTLAYLREHPIAFDHAIAQRVACDWFESNGRDAPVVIPSTKQVYNRTANELYYYAETKNIAARWALFFWQISSAIIVRRGADKRMNEAVLTNLRRTEELTREP